MMPSSNQRYYSRFIPSEEVGAVTQWKFGAVDGSDLVESEPEPEALPEVPVIDEAAQLALVQQACDDAYAQGFAQAQAETALEWQRRMDDYVAQQGQELAQSLHAVSQSLDASLAGIQQKMAQDVLALACDIAREVVRQELSCNPQVLLPVVQEAVGMLLSEGRPAVVRMNPSDMEAVQAPLTSLVGGSGCNGCRMQRLPQVIARLSLVARSSMRRLPSAGTALWLLWGCSRPGRALFGGDEHAD